MSSSSTNDKIKTLVQGGAFLLLMGYGLDSMEVTPIVKRIATSTFVLATGGWCLLVLALLYWWVDVKGHQAWAKFAIIVGTNSIFIYLFSETIGVQWLRGFGEIFTFGILEHLDLSEPLMAFINALVVWAILWYICYFLYRRKVFIKI